MSSESKSCPCGCRYIRPRSETADALFWYQVVACPDHEIDCRPMAEIEHTHSRYSGAPLTHVHVRGGESHRHFGHPEDKANGR